MRIAFTLVMLLYAYGLQNSVMAILGVAFIWLGYGIAIRFDPNMATIHWNGRRPKIFELVALAVSYAVSFFVISVAWPLIDAFDFRSSQLQAARDHPCSQALFSGCYEVMIIENYAPLAGVAFALLPAIIQARRKRDDARGPAPRWPIAAGLGGGALVVFGLCAIWNAILLPPNSGWLSATAITRFGTQFDILALGLSIWLQGLMANENRRLDATQAYHRGIYGLIFGCILGVAMLVILPGMAAGERWFLAIPLAYAAVLAIPLLGLPAESLVLAVTSHVMLVCGVGVLMGIPTTIVRQDVDSFVVGLFGLPLLPFVAIGFFWLVRFQKRWLAMDLARYGLAPAA